MLGNNEYDMCVCVDVIVLSLPVNETNLYTQMVGFAFGL